MSTISAPLTDPVHAAPTPAASTPAATGKTLNYLNSEHGIKSWLLTQDHKRRWGPATCWPRSISFAR